MTTVLGRCDSTCANALVPRHAQTMNASFEIVVFDTTLLLAGAARGECPLEYHFLILEHG